MLLFTLGIRSRTRIVGARCHGGEGSWVPIADRCVGYNQVDASIDAFLDPEAFARYPDAPLTLKEFGCEAMLVSYEEGVLQDLPGLMHIQTLPSFLSKELFVTKGDKLHKTVDMFTTPGSVMLVHPSQDILNQDLDTIRALELSGMYQLSY